MGSAHAFYTRFECLVFVVGTRLALSSAICAQLAVDADDAFLTGSLALMLLVHSLLANGTGLLVFFLFGLGENVFDPKLLWPSKPLTASGRLPLPQPAATTAARKRSVVVQELLDATQSVAMGTGYESPRKLEAVVERAHAAEVMQRFARKHIKIQEGKQKVA